MGYITLCFVLCCVSPPATTQNPESASEGLHEGCGRRLACPGHPAREQSPSWRWAPSKKGERYAQYKVENYQGRHLGADAGHDGRHAEAFSQRVFYARK